MEEEIWVPIIEFEGLYEISNLGRVKSLDRVIQYPNHKVFRKGRIRKLTIDSDGYQVVGLCKNRISGNKRVNRLVALHFIPNPNNYKIVNHKKGIKIDNRATELEWCTNAENIQHAFDNGLIKASVGSRCGASKWKEKDIIKIRNLAAQGIMHKDIASKYKMSKRNIHNIINRKSWIHI